VSFVAVIFDVEKGKPLPKNVKYTIRLPHNEPNGRSKTWRTSRTYPNFQSVGPREDRYDYFMTKIKHRLNLAGKCLTVQIIVYCLSDRSINYTLYCYTCVMFYISNLYVFSLPEVGGGYYKWKQMDANGKCSK